MLRPLRAMMSIRMLFLRMLKPMTASNPKLMSYKKMVSRLKILKLMRP